MLYPINIATQFSLFQGVRLPDEYAAAAKHMGAAAVGIADDGLLIGAPFLYWAAHRYRIPALLGCRLELDGGGALVALARHEAGYARLVALLNHRPAPRFRPEDFKKNVGDGLILILAEFDDPLGDDLRRWVHELKQTAPAELLHLGLTADAIAAAPWRTEAVRKRFGIEPLHLERIWGVAADDERTRRLLAGLERKKGEPPRPLQPGLHLEAFPEAVERAYAKDRETVRRWEAVAKACTFEFSTLTDILPRFDVPAAMSKTDYFLDQVRRGLAARLATKPNAATLETGRYAERLRRELEVILGFNYADYFLIVADLVAYARQRGIAVGPGRGSGVGSLTAYALGVTDIDPIEHNLAFETFLNKERIKLPDIDLDFCARHRDLMLAYVREKYGAQDVMRLTTVMRYQSRMALRKAAEVCGLPPEQAQNCFPEVWRNGAPLPEKPLGREPHDTLLDAARRLVGRVCGYGVHPSGVVVVAHKGYLPVMPTPDQTAMEPAVTQFPHDAATGLRMVKFDLLSLNHLTILHDTEAAIQSAGCPDFRRGDVPGDDWLTFAALRRGETRGVFQLEGESMTRLVRELQPHRLQDLMTGVAMHRPGPLAALRRRRRDEDPLPAVVRRFLEPFLAETHGAVLYKEQVMHIYANLTGEEPGRGLLYLEALRTGEPTACAPFVAELHRGAAQRGWRATDADALHRFLSRFGQYTFNRCLTGDTELWDAESGRTVTVAELAGDAPCAAATHRRPTLVWTMTPTGWDVTPVAGVTFAGRKNVVPWRRLGVNIPGGVSTDHRLWTANGWTTAGDLVAKASPPTQHLT